jgi:hypothetical protein
MPLVGRNALLYRAVYPSNLTVNPPANSYSETFTSAERMDEGEKARVTYSYTSNANITELYAVFQWLDKNSTEISRDTVNITPNTSGTRTDEKTAPANTYSFKFGIRAKSGASAGTASFTSITERILFGMAKTVSTSIDAALVKEYVLGSDTPAYLASGNKTFKVSIDVLYANDKYASKVLAGTQFDVVIAPNGWGSGNPLVTLRDVVINSWKQSIDQAGVIAESLSGEGDSVTLETQS